MKNLGITLVICITVLLLAGLGAVVYLQSGQKETVSVTGTAMQGFSPDRADITIQLTELGEKQDVAAKNVSDRLVALQAALTSIGIDEKLLQQGQVSISPYYDYRLPTPETNKKQVSQTLTIRLDSSKVGSVTDSAKKVTQAVFALSPGVDTYSLNYDFENRAKISETLREKAVTDAREKAQRTASALRVSLGDVQSIQENGGGGIVRPMPYVFDKSMGMPASASVAIEPQSQNLEFSVLVTYQLRKKILGIF